MQEILNQLATNQDSRNAEFWNELCGSEIAKFLGVTDAHTESLKRFDDWYFDYYPYLFKHIPFGEMDKKIVLEVGLGYGTVSQKLAESGAYFHGLDIAKNPVEMVRHRLKQIVLSGDVRQGSILECPFPDNLFDYVVAIGSYHHTGDLQRALDESYRILKPGGVLVMMVYNAYSYRRWYKAFMPTVKYFLWDYLDVGVLPKSTAEERAAYDQNSRDEAAPYTTFVSCHRLRRMCHRFSNVQTTRENILQEGPFRWCERRNMLQSWPKFVGLDIYAVARK